MAEEDKRENSSVSTVPGTPVSQLILLLSPFVESLGYEVVHIEVQTHKQKLLRLFIDFLGATEQQKAVGIEDCVRVTHAVSEPMDQDPSLVRAVEAIFHGSAYELEVSSPGVDRPLRQAKDFLRFAGKEARIHIFRPLTAGEMENVEYQERNPKQKNFFGTLQGIRGAKDEEKILMAVPRDGGASGQKKGKGKAKGNESAVDEIAIPLPLITKANLEPKFEI